MRILKPNAAALKKYKSAAEQGHASAQCNLGVIYANGRGVEQNDAEAVRWYDLAAEQGNASAQYNLGIRYAKGKTTGQQRNLPH